MANKKYTEFTAGFPASGDIFLLADPTTGLLKKVPYSLPNRTFGTLTTMLAVGSPVNGQEYYISDYLFFIFFIDCHVIKSPFTSLNLSLF